MIHDGWKDPFFHAFKDSTFTDIHQIIWAETNNSENTEVFAILEKVHTMPKQGIASAGKFMEHFGFLQGILTANGVPYEMISPQRWQKDMGCLTGGNKNVSKAAAQRLFPSIKMTHAIADAILLAEYCRRLIAQRTLS